MKKANSITTVTAYLTITSKQGFPKGEVFYVIPISLSSACSLYLWHCLGAVCMLNYMLVVRPNSVSGNETSIVMKRNCRASGRQTLYTRGFPSSYSSSLVISLFNTAQGLLLT